MNKVNLAEKFSLFEDLWSPRIAGEVGDYWVKLAKLKGRFVWHTHEKEDELFLVVRGSLTIRLSDEDVRLSAGEFFIVPHGIEHMPVADEEVHVMLFEPKTTVNTGDVSNERTKTECAGYEFVPVVGDSATQSPATPIGDSDPTTCGPVDERREGYVVKALTFLLSSLAGVLLATAAFPAAASDTSPAHVSPPFIVEPIYRTIGPFSEGLALAADGDKIGYIDTAGKVVIEAAFDGAGTFSDGLAVVNIGGDHCFIDRTGAVVISTPYDWLEPFAEDRALFRDGDAYGFIDRRGNVVVQALYDKALPFSEGLSAVMVGERWGYIDREGAVVIEPRYEEARPFLGGLAEVKVGGKWGVIGKPPR